MSSMSSVSRVLALAAAAGIVAAAIGVAMVRSRAGEGSATVAAGDLAGALRVCADPNNLPYSNQREEGFENALARLIAADMGRAVEYYWWPQRFGFVRNTLRMNVCDVIMGVPADYELAATTAPYYRSTYAFVSRRDRGLGLDSLDDARLRNLRIGVHLVGDDYSNVPPVMALARRGLGENIVGYSVYGDYGDEDPPLALIRAVADGEVDVALAWGPLAGYFARRADRSGDVALEVVPLTGDDAVEARFAFDIAVGFRPEDAGLGRAIDDALRRRRADVRALLDDFGIPVVGVTDEPPADTARAGMERGP